MTVRELIDELQRENPRAEVEIDYPASGGENARPCEGVGASSPGRVILWAKSEEE